MMEPTTTLPDDSIENWRAQRRQGVRSIVIAFGVAVPVWFGIWLLAPSLADMTDLSNRLAFALKCCCFAALFTLVMGVEAVAHERLQSPAFNPLAGHETRRLRVNQRYLQNTLEQFVIFATALLGLAAVAEGEAEMRAALATTAVWIIGRLAFWGGYHHSAAMRGLGAPGIPVGMLVLLYVVTVAAKDAAGWLGAVMVLGCFVAFEAFLFRATKSTNYRSE